MTGDDEDLYERLMRDVRERWGDGETRLSRLLREAIEKAREEGELG